MADFTFLVNRLRGRGFSTVAEIRQELSKQGKRASGDLIEKTRFTVEERPALISFKIFAPAHWEFVDQGRRPGTFPPVNRILRWIRQKSITTDISRNSLAFLIGRKIKEKGIPATNIYTNAIDNLKNSLDIPSLAQQDIEKRVLNALTK